MQKENGIKETRSMDEMRKEYDFSKAVKNPYVSKLKKQITINLDDRIITYFKNEAMESGIPYQSLINLYLLDCVLENRKLKISWE
jgi:predicted DNA binding CopG/RHH family protein